MLKVQGVTSFDPLAAMSTAAVSACAVSTLVSLLQEAKLITRIGERRKKMRDDSEGGGGMSMPFNCCRSRPF